MHYSGPVVRPPHEANSILLEVTVGCTHNECRFCTFYKDTKFKVAPLTQIEEDLKEAQSINPDAKRVYAVGGDPFSLSFIRLKEIAELINKYLPKANIAMYARITSIKNKSIEELKILRSLGINDLVIGVESGDDEVLSMVNKGYNSAEIITECKKLEEAGIIYRVIYLGGLAGSKKGERNAINTAKVFNELNPIFIYLTTVTIFNDCAMHEDVENGSFIEPTEKERIQEILTFVENLEKKLTIDARTISNPVQFKVNLPEDKNRIVESLKDILNNFSEEDEKVLRMYRDNIDVI